MTPIEVILWLLDAMNCGAVVLDDLGAVSALNKCAANILAKQASRHGCGAREPESASKLLRHLFGKDFAFSEGETITANGGNRAVHPLVACNFIVSPNGAPAPLRVLLLLDLDERPTPRTAVLRQTFGLTDAEARLAAQLALGDSLQTIAAEYKVTIDTARAQLKSVLAKTHTHRQAELVALVNRLAAFPKLNPADLQS